MKARARGLTDKQKSILVKLSQREHPVKPATLGCSKSVLQRLAQGGLVICTTDEVGNQAWDITRNGLVLLHMINRNTVVPELRGK